MITQPRPLAHYVREKWFTPEHKEWWYTKHTAARRAKLARLSEQQAHRCAYCGCRTWLHGVDKPVRWNRFRNQSRATLEHVIPQSQGGTDSMFNLVMACAPCNSARGSMDCESFCEMIRIHGRASSIPKPARVARENDANHQVRKTALTWQLALVLHYQPGWHPHVDEFLALERPS